ncbi:hypothetical protein BDN67DRAFT_1065964 [Paxillus ammoniavirescens]|nr:hypothetical protein BDN67DRAFT_1065964 [Paxillus ammoniavirescens]
MDGEEYEVESVTRARVHDKRGKKITWRYYVKWKGYGWDDSTWEPTESFQTGSEHILEAFWQRINTDGRDISDAQAFKKGEELFISGPPGKKGLKRKASTVNVKAPPSPEQVTASNEAPSPTPRKRRRMRLAYEDEDETEELMPKRKAKAIPLPRLQRRVSGGGQRDVKKPAKSPRRRRASYPGPRKSAPKRLPSAGDSQLDADGETDPDAIEVDDELAQMSTEDAAERPALRGRSNANNTLDGGANSIEFDDLDHFYSGNTIDIEQSAEAPEPIQERKTRGPQTSKLRVPTSPAPSSPDPLFDSPSDQAWEATRDPSVPFHRSRAANPRVKLIDTTTAETKGAESRITAKGRLMSLPVSSASSSAGRSQSTAKRGAKPGPGRSSSGFNKNRSSLLTATKGILQSVKGKFTATNVGSVKPDEIEEAPAAVASEERKFTISSWSDEDVVAEPGLDDQTVAHAESASFASGDGSLKSTGQQKDTEMLPDYEDDSAAQENVAEQPSSPGSAKVEDKSPEQSAAVATSGTKTIIADAADSVTDLVAQASDSAIEPSAPSIDPTTATAEEAAKKSVELAKEQLFPSVQLSSNAFGDVPSSFRSTIFGPLYQGVTSNHAAADGNESLATFKLVLDDSIGLPLTLKDCSQIKGRINDISVGKSSSGRVAVFYESDDALAIVTALKSSGTARVVLDPSADATQRENFATFLRRFESSHTLVAPAGKEITVLYLSENAGIAEKLCAPSNLVGLTSTLLISRASIEDQLAYVAAAFAAKTI